MDRNVLKSTVNFTETNNYLKNSLLDDYSIIKKIWKDLGMSYNYKKIIDKYIIFFLYLNFYFYIIKN